jgi:5'(3')-deoxyribonucleotidase
MTKVLLDMDGVIADFVAGACAHHGIANPWDRPEMLGEWDFMKALPEGMSATTFWGSLGLDFWANLDKTSEADELVEYLEQRFGEENICILSSPCLTPGCVEGKLLWIKKHYPRLARSYLFGPRKEFCARPNTLLIDDLDHNVWKFREHGGAAILFPRPWNSSHRFPRDIRPALEFADWRPQHA